MFDNKVKSCTIPVMNVNVMKAKCWLMSCIEINPLSKNRVQHTKIGLCRVAYPPSGQWRSAGRARAIPLANESGVRHIDLLEPRAGPRAGRMALRRRMC